jgi:hypothetical protein
MIKPLRVINAAQKWHIKLTSSYFWPNVYSQVLKHKQTCLRCQQCKSCKLKPPPLTMLPIPEQPNVRIHADLFGPMMGADHEHAYILCITDAFTKYAVVTSIPNKEAETEPFLKTGSVNLAFQHKFTQMEVKNSSTRYLLNCLNSSMFSILKLWQHTLNAMLRWKFLIGQSKNTLPPMWMNQP